MHVAKHEMGVIDYAIEYISLARALELAAAGTTLVAEEQDRLLPIRADEDETDLVAARAETATVAPARNRS